MVKYVQHNSKTDKKIEKSYKSFFSKINRVGISKFIP